VNHAEVPPFADRANGERFDLKYQEYRTRIVMLTVTSAAIDAVKVITPKLIADSRGSFCETYNQERFADHGIMPTFVQDNDSVSAAIGTIRGLHFQSDPAAQAKLIRVLKGRIFDVAVDLRRSSPTYGKWVAHEISAENRKQVFIPVGFAHGFCALEVDTHVSYKVSAHYSPSNEFGVAWDDPVLRIDWPVAPSRAVLSDRDHRMPALNSLPPYFE
jgi:dTDP-4-dehydrorhamnose 3,5-epimerase